MQLYKVAFTGHRPPKIGGYNKDNPLRIAVRQAIKDTLQRIIDTHKDCEVVVISGGALGVDTDAASVADELSLRFIVAAPCKNQDSKWPAESQQAYQAMCSAADTELAQELSANYEGTSGKDGVLYIHDGSYTSFCMQKRNEWMVNNCDELVAIWDSTPGGTANCVNFAKLIGCKITRIHPGDLL